MALRDRCGHLDFDQPFLVAVPFARGRLAEAVSVDLTLLVSEITVDDKAVQVKAQTLGNLNRDTA
jgi:hypothetical protein